MQWNPTQWLTPRGKWAESAKYWRTAPRSAMSLVLAGIFCLFAAFGLMISLINVSRGLISFGIFMGLSSGLFGVLLAWCAFRANLKAVIVITIVQTILINWVANIFARHTVPLTGSSADFMTIQRRTQAEAVMATFLIIAGYSLISAFMRKEGMRVFGATTELRLATEIHRALVPAFSHTAGRFEICGSSTPSGQMGGDLVDLIENGNRWTAYVADVSGHGVPAGMIMAMVKSAARMGSASNSNPRVAPPPTAVSSAHGGVESPSAVSFANEMSSTLSNLNQVLASLSAANVFVTFACISGADDSQVQFSLAGHLPILHYRKRLGAVEERVVSNLPLAVVPDSEFQTASIECEPGDLLVVLTDGFTEVSNARGEELGLDPFKSVMLNNGNASLEAIITSLRETAARHGKQADDQTVLLVRRLG